MTLELFLNNLERFYAFLPSLSSLHRMYSFKEKYVFICVERIKLITAINLNVKHDKIYTAHFDQVDR